MWTLEAARAVVIVCVGIITLPNFDFVKTSESPSGDSYGMKVCNLYFF